jgi:hypothetical protein
VRALLRNICAQARRESLVPTASPSSYHQLGPSAATALCRKVRICHGSDLLRRPVTDTQLVRQAHRALPVLAEQVVQLPVQKPKHHVTPKPMTPGASVLCRFRGTASSHPSPCTWTTGIGPASYRSEAKHKPRPQPMPPKPHPPHGSLLMRHKNREAGGSVSSWYCSKWERKQ